MSVLSHNMNVGNLPAPAPEPVAACVAAAAAPNNKLLDGACDDDDNELTEAQKALIAERMKVLQARFKAFEERLAHDSLTEAEAEMLLRVCNNNSSRRATG